MSAALQLIDWVEKGYLPDALVRRGIRRLCKTRLEEIGADCETRAAASEDFLAAMRGAPVAAVPETANAQHYEVPAPFFTEVLGPARKYSCCHWADGVTQLSDAEDSALILTCERAEIQNGQDILELGCGWGSLSLWMAKAYPDARITAVSNSGSQREFIVAQAAGAGLDNLSVITADMNVFTPDRRYDRVVSVEMFEHMRNWSALFTRVHGWLKPGGLFFMHIFCHRDTPYLFEDQGDDDWMSRHFFSGGMMPSDALPARIQSPLRLARQWRWSGQHYEKTCNAWLANMDARRERILPILASAYGADQVELWWMRWRLFFMACAETFGYDGGQEWWISHYLFERQS